MNEEMWLAGTHPLDMVEYVLDKVSMRKLRLLAAACCQAVGRYEAELACERVADGLCDVSALAAVPNRVAPQAGGRNTARRYAGHPPARISPELQANHVVWAATHSDPVEAARAAAYHVFPQLQGDLIDLVREIVGNPFRATPVEGAWLRAGDRAVLGLARAVYEEQAFDRLPILADALVDAGCDDEELLGHLREQTGHRRGCWALDALLGKA